MIGWTGGQYSLYRVALGLFLLFGLAGPLVSGSAAATRTGRAPVLGLLPNVLASAQDPLAGWAVGGVAALLCVAVILGRWDRAGAVGLWYLLACAFGFDPRTDLGWLLLGAVLLLHALVPPAPYGSWAARGRADPGGGWRMPPAPFRIAWVTVALVYAYHGLSAAVRLDPDGAIVGRLAGLAHPGAETWLLGFTLVFPVLSPVRRARPWLWLVAALVHASMWLAGAGGWHAPMLASLGFVFDPAWIPPERDPRPDRVFYDGHCGLCHGAVRFLIAEDAGGRSFRFAPLQGETFAATLERGARERLPDSIVLISGDGAVRVRSEAVLRAARRLGGLWRMAAWAAGRVPTAPRDALYDGIARARRRVFGTREELCPLIPGPIGERFDP